MKYTIEQMEALGISDYYLTLTQYIESFVNRNYPLSREDMTAIINGIQTESIIKRNEVFCVLKDSMTRILMGEADINKQKLENWNNGIFSPVLTVEEYNQKIFGFKQQMMEDLFNYQNGYSDINEQNKRNGRR